MFTDKHTTVYVWSGSEYAYALSYTEILNSTVSHLFSYLLLVSKLYEFYFLNYPTSLSIIYIWDHSAIYGNISFNY